MQMTDIQAACESIQSGRTETREERDALINLREGHVRAHGSDTQALLDEEIESANALSDELRLANELISKLRKILGRAIIAPSDSDAVSELMLAE
jgi:hypothetical protein